MTTFTPGPWRINVGHNGAFYITAETNTAIAATYEPNQPMNKIVGAANPEANARLIAASPTMLKALCDVRLELWVDYCLHVGIFDADPAPFNSRPLIVAIDAAITEAVGS